MVGNQGYASLPKAALIRPTFNWAWGCWFSSCSGVDAQSILAATGLGRIASTWRITLDAADGAELLIDLFAAVFAY